MESKRIRNILEKYFDGRSTLAEERELKKYFTEEKDIPADLLYAREIFAHFESGKKKKFPNQRKLVIPKFAVAASILILAGIFSLLIWNHSTSSGSLIVRKNETGKVLKITLSNNDVIWLNKNGRVTFPRKVNGDHDTITVNGEVYFELHGNNYDIVANHTLIKTEKITSFNIRALEGMSTVDITVETGSVKVFEGLDPDGLAVFVKGGYYCSVHRSQKFIFTSAIRDVNYKSWKTGEFKFDGIPMATVASILSDYYNVHIELENRQMAYCPFSGDFKKESLDHILDNIKDQLNFKITSTGDVITLSGENCF